MYKLFSQRKREEENGVSDVYIYNKFSKEFRNQYFHIIKSVFNSNGDDIYYTYDGIINLWKIASESFAREKGFKCLYDSTHFYSNNVSAYEKYVDESSDEDFLDLMDYTYTVIISNKDTRTIVGRAKIDDAIEELNYRFKQHSLGYEFINGNLIEKTNEQIHKAIIKPALHLLSNKSFQGAEEEYFQAFDFFKEGKNKEAILNAIKAFESVLKTICEKMKYPYDKDKDGAKQLLQHLSENNFYPNYLESHLTGIRLTLESGAPALRNKKAGHGQGSEVVSVSDEYVEYALNLVATNIVFLVKLFNQKNGE